MWPFLKNLVTDETRFVGLSRAVLIGLGTALATETLDLSALGLSETAQQVVGVLTASFGGFVRSSSSESVPTVEDVTTPARRR